MAINPDNEQATRDHLKQLACALDTAPHGERGGMVADFARSRGWSTAKVYARLKRVGWESGRKKRADAGATQQSTESLLMLTSTMRQCIRKNGKATMHTPTARSVLAVNDVEFKVGNARLNTLLKKHQMDIASQKQQRAFHSMRSLHPNHVHQVDPSLCLIYYLPDGKQAIIRDDEVYKNKPENIQRLGKLKVWRYVLIDHYSASIIVRYYRARGESQSNLFDFLLYCWSRCDARPFHGVPKILYWDKGSANTAHAIKNALKALTVMPIEHEQGNPRATGSVEGAQNIVETHFESRLRLEPVKNLDELNAAAEAWCEAFNADRIPQYDARLKRSGMREPVSRYGLWQTIKADELRLLPPVNVCRHLLSSDPIDRTVRADLTISFKHPGADKTLTYDLAGIPEVFPRGTVRVSPLVYGHLQVIVYTLNHKDEERTYIIEPVKYDEVAGFRLDAAIIGEEMKSKPDTSIERAGKAADNMAFPGKSSREIKSAKDKNAAPFGGTLDAHSHLADVVPPSFMRRPGTDLHVPDRSRPSTKPMSITEACKRLVLALGPASRDVNYYEMVKAWCPDGVPEEAFNRLLARVRGDAPDQHIKQSSI